MAVSDLRNYDYWVGKSARYIKDSVLCTVKGWETVFPRTGKFPAWASVVRNYFNETPTELASVGIRDATRLVQNLSWHTMYSVQGTLHYPVVFVDRADRHWFLMLPVGAAYHKGDGSPSGWEKFKGLFTTQNNSIFKLVSPDGTGGSSELIVKNPDETRWLAGENRGDYMRNKRSAWTSITNNIEFSSAIRGTYNYAETLVEGFNAHSFADVEPHTRSNGNYQFPTNFSSLESRIFPRLARSANVK